MIEVTTSASVLVARRAVKFSVTDVLLASLGFVTGETILTEGPGAALVLGIGGKGGIRTLEGALHPLPA